jgi:hypothetical protein
MRVIDADDLKSELKFPDERLNRVFACMIDNSPTIELIRHAEWLPVRDTPFFEYVYACSTCGRECGGRSLTNYCGDCGSKMSVRRD